jgi:hypothetical protein
MAGGWTHLKHERDGGHADVLLDVAVGVDLVDHLADQDVVGEIQWLRVSHGGILSLRQYAGAAHTHNHMTQQR